MPPTPRAPRSPGPSRPAGDVVDRTNVWSNALATRSYDAFGALVATTGTPVGPFGFAGEHGYQEDGDSGLKLLGHRYYDPSTGRFLTRDPIQDGRNWYAYCDGNPLKRVDPDGLRALSIGFGGQVIFIGMSVSVHVDVSLDLDTGGLGIAPSFGIGPAAGWGAGAGVEGSLDAGATVPTNTKPTKGMATGFATPVICAEFYDDGNYNHVGGSVTGTGVSSGMAGGGVYREERKGLMIPVGHVPNWPGWYAR